MSKCITYAITVGAVFLAGTFSYAQGTCLNAKDGVYVPRESPQYAEVIAASDVGPAAVWAGSVEWYGPLSAPQRHFKPPQANDRLVWLYGTNNPSWQANFSTPSTEVWVQLNGCDANDGWAKFYVDGAYICQWYTKNKGSVLIKLVGLPNVAHSVTVEKESSNGPYVDDVSIDYAAVPHLSEVKMHFPQLPDEDGWDVNATSPLVVADDWRCTESSLINELCFWGSWKDGVVGTITSFHLSVHGDIPAGPLQGFSMPGEVLWEGDFPIEAFTVDLIDPGVQEEGWYDPSTGLYLVDNHQQYFKYCLTDIAKPIKQQEGNIYWLDISATVTGGVWGWKTSEDAWNDDAVWSPELAEPTWDEMYDPLDEPATTNAFAVNAAVLIPPGPVGDWYFYPNTGWWNVWFFDHPIDWNSGKVVHIHIDVDDAQPGAYLAVAVNWSTFMWTLEGTPGEPPLPPEVPSPELEDLYIGREILLPERLVTTGQEFDLYWVWPHYNPEWVSVDVRGEGFGISGSITHRCASSLNQAFEIRTSTLIPAVTEWGLVVLVLLVLAAGTMVIRRARAAAA